MGGEAGLVGKTPDLAPGLWAGGLQLLKGSVALWLEFCHVL